MNPSNPREFIIGILAAIGLGVILKPLLPIANRIFERVMFRPEHRNKN